MIWLLMAFVGIFVLTFNLTLFCGCRPLSAWWWQFDPAWTTSHSYTCVPETNLLMAACALSVIQDFLVAGLPTFIFARMDLPFRQKLALAGVFAVGFFLCVAGVLRIVYIHQVYYETYDLTWASQDAWQWTAIEGLLGSIVASVPALKIFFQRHLESIQASSWGYGYPGNSNRQSPWPHSANRLSDRISRRFSSNGWGWARNSSNTEFHNVGVHKGGRDYQLERVIERPSKEGHGREIPVLPVRRITSEDVRHEEELERRHMDEGRPSQEIGRIDSRQRALSSHPIISPISPVSPISNFSPGSPLKDSRITWDSAQTGDFSMSGEIGPERDKGFDSDIHALPILTEQETRDMGLVGVAQ